MHDFDTEQRAEHDQLLSEGHHAFTLRGEEFLLRRIVPYATLRKLANMGTYKTDAELLGAVESAVMDLLINDEHRQRFQALLNDSQAEFPVTYTDLLKIQRWMVAEASGRPPTQPQSSSESSSTNGSDATENSSPPPEGASTT